MKFKTAAGTADRRRVEVSTADRSRYSAMSGGYTPDRLTDIFAAANMGDIEALCICGREIMERNWDVIGAMEQRTSALTGAAYDIQPGGDTPADHAAAEAFEKALRSAGELNNLDSFQELLPHLATAAILPFAPAEIVWGEGGTLQGFQILEPHYFTLRDGFVPRLICDEYPNGLPVEEQKHRFIFHQHRKKQDPARSGKIRVLAWLHVFQNWPIKDLFSFIERFGMPFVVAKVDSRTWDEERHVLNDLIRSFGPNGGGVFSRNTELQLLNAANTGSDNVYFRALEFTHNAIYTMLVGQLASSGDAAGMSNGDAQTAVRQDILEADARAVEATVRSQIAAPWTAFQYGPTVAVPRIHFQVEPAEDLSALAQTVATLYNGGLEADPAEMSEKFGIKLSRREMPASAPGSGFPMSAEPENAQTTVPGLVTAMNEWLGPVADGIADAVNLSDDELDRLLRSGNIAESGDSTKLAAIMEQEMRKEYNRGHKIQHRS